MAKFCPRSCWMTPNLPEYSSCSSCRRRMTDDRLAFRYINTKLAQWVKLSPSLATQLAVQVNVRAGHPASRLADRGHSTVMYFKLPLSISTVWPASARTLTGLAFWPAFSLTLLYLLFYCSCWRVTLRKNVLWENARSTKKCWPNILFKWTIRKTNNKLFQKFSH